MRGLKTVSDHSDSEVNISEGVPTQLPLVKKETDDQVVFTALSASKILQEKPVDLYKIFCTIDQYCDLYSLNLLREIAASPSKHPDEQLFAIEYIHNLGMRNEAIALVNSYLQNTPDTEKDYFWIAHVADLVGMRDMAIGLYKLSALHDPETYFEQIAASLATYMLENELVALIERRAQSINTEGPL